MAKPLGKERFDLYSIGTRMSQMQYMSEELSYWSNLDETIIGVVVRDITDNDFGWVLMARDKIGRFRAVRLNTSLRSIRRAEAELRLKIAEVSRSANIDDLGIQGDETNSAINLLEILPGTDPNELHPFFKQLIETAGRKPARAVLKEIGPWLAAADPHFVREFQRHQFDQRLWELYIWAVLREGLYDVRQLESPDFKALSPRGSFTIEATTVAPSQSGALADHPNPETVEETKEFLDDYMAIKYAGSLTSKLNRKSASGKRYWEEPDAKGLPFLIAVADFHKQAEGKSLASMTFTQSALWPYLYGKALVRKYVGSEMIAETEDIDSHIYNGKKIESGFFNLADAENVSAVLFSNAGTLAKFDRMGVLAGLGAPNHKYVRMGVRLDPDPKAVVGNSFRMDIEDPDYQELWAEEIQIFHNPNAKIPLPFDCFSGLTQHFLEDGKLQSFGGPDTILSSYTAIFNIKDREP